MSQEPGKTWPSVPPTQLKLQRETPRAAEPTPPTPPSAAAGAPAAPPTPVGALGSAARRPAKQPLTLQAWLVRVAAGVVLVGSLAAVYWSYQRLAPLQERSRVLSERVTRLGNEIALMEGRYTPADLEKLAEDFRFAGQQLFGTEQDLASWFEILKRELVPLALEASAEFGRPAPPPAGETNLNVAVVPATLTLNLKPSADAASIRSPYERVLTLLDELSRQPKRVDLVALNVSAGTNSINQVRTVLELWAGEVSTP